MKSSFEFKQLMLAGVLILAGLLAPSEGLDNLIKDSARSVVLVLVVTIMITAVAFQIYSKVTQWWKKPMEGKAQKA
jgi:hypothetical protein